MRGHGDLGTVRKDGLWIAGKLFNKAENVVPAAAIEARRMVSELVEDFVHLECCHNRFDQDCCANTAIGNAKLLLGKNKDVVPEPRLQMTLHFRQVEVRPGAGRKQKFRVMKKVKAEIEQGAGHGLPVHKNVALVEMPAPRTNEKHGRSLVQLIFLPASRI